MLTICSTVHCYITTNVLCCCAYTLTHIHLTHTQDMYRYYRMCSSTVQRFEIFSSVWMEMVPEFIHWTGLSSTAVSWFGMNMDPYLSMLYCWNKSTSSQNLTTNHQFIESKFIINRSKIELLMDHQLCSHTTR